MNCRVTIVLDNKIMMKLRKLQADKIRNSSNSISFSKIINNTLEIGLKHVV